MIEIKPNALYTRDDLIALLAPLGLDADTFVARLAPRKVFRQVWYGRDLLKALDEAPPLKEPPAVSAPLAKAHPLRRNHPQKSAISVQRFRNLLNTPENP